MVEQPTSPIVYSQIEPDRSSVVMTATQAPLLADDTEMIEEYMPVNSHMIDGVPLLVQMDEYRARAQEI